MLSFSQSSVLKRIIRTLHSLLPYYYILIVSPLVPYPLTKSTRWSMKPALLFYFTKRINSSRNSMLAFSTHSHAVASAPRHQSLLRFSNTYRCRRSAVSSASGNRSRGGGSSSKSARMMAAVADTSAVNEGEGTTREKLTKSRTQRIMESMPSSKQAMGAGGSSTYEVRAQGAPARGLILPGDLCSTAALLQCCCC